MSEDLYLRDVINYVLKSEDREAEAIRAALRTRAKNKGNERAAKVTVGARVRLTGLSPVVLNDLVGEVVSITRSRADILLTEEATIGLKMTSDKYRGVITEARHTLRGVPTACLVVIA